MAKPVGCTASEVLIIDQQNGDEKKDVFLRSDPSQIQLHTGNIANWNSLRMRKTQLPVNELFQSLKNTLENWVEKPVDIPTQKKDCGYNFETFESAEERPLLKISVKVMLQKFDATCVEKAIDAVRNKLKLEYIDSVFLALPTVDDENTDFEETVEPYWRELERLHEKGTVQNIASCDLDQNKLEKLVNLSKIKPEVNQVNLMSCCHMPEDLVAYAKAVDVVLHTHGDQPEMLPEDKVSELIRSVEPSNQLDWRCDWIARYTVVVKCRGVIKCKGYIASIASQ